MHAALKAQSAPVISQTCVFRLWAKQDLALATPKVFKKKVKSVLNLRSDTLGYFLKKIILRVLFLTL